MRMLMLVSLVAVGLGLALVVREPAYARTRTPTPTLTPVPVSTSTPVAPKPAVFFGEAWVDGDISPGPLVAKIGDTVCGTDTFLSTPPANFSYQVEVASEEATPGCGVDGAIVSFFVAGRQAAETAVWHSGTFQHLTLIVGPFFSMFAGGATINQTLTSEKLVAFVGNTACGDYSEWIGGGPVYSYFISVSSSQLPGCGTEGAEVTFKLLDAEGSVIAIANEKGVWHVWDDVLEPYERLNLTFGPAGGIKIGNVGTGESQHSGTLWRELSLVLAAVGLGGIAAGVALRKRAM